jgi:signal transduction histidine kinase
LYLTKALVEAQGGRIGVESEGEGKGSTFFFVLPIA